MGAAAIEAVAGVAEEPQVFELVGTALGLSDDSKFMPRMMLRLSPVHMVRFAQLAGRHALLLSTKCIQTTVIFRYDVLEILIV